MKKIVIDARMINNSGIGTYTKQLIAALSNSFELIIMGNKTLLQSNYNLKNISVIQYGSSIYSIREQFELPNKIPRCDIFISPHYNIPLLPVKAKKRIVIIHDVYHLAFYSTLSIKQKLYAKTLINSAVKICDSVVTVSNFSKSEIIKYTHAIESKISVINFGIDTAQFIRGNNSDEPQQTLSKYNLPKKFFLFVGNIKPHKNLYNLLLAFELFLKQNRNYKLVIAGKKEGLITQDNNVFNLINSNKNLKENVLFTGYISYKELSSLYKAADTLVFPSYYEGFGIPPLEAMLAGCPVIASNAASIPEVCGDAALYFDPFDYINICNKMLTIISYSEERKRLVKKGFENCKKFPFKDFSDKWNNLILCI